MTTYVCCHRIRFDILWPTLIERDWSCHRFGYSHFSGPLLLPALQLRAHEVGSCSLFWWAIPIKFRYPHRYHAEKMTQFYIRKKKVFTKVCSNLFVRDFANRVEFSHVIFARRVYVSAIFLREKERMFEYDFFASSEGVELLFIQPGQSRAAPASSSLFLAKTFIHAACPRARFHFILIPNSWQLLPQFIMAAALSSVKIKAMIMDNLSAIIA